MTAHSSIGATDLLQTLRAAAEPTRLRILALCARGELTVSELMRILGQSQPRVSRHLRLLAEAGLLERFREGSWVFHRLRPEGESVAVVRDLVARLADDDALLRDDLTRLAGVKRERTAQAAAYFAANAAEWDRLRSLHVDDAEVERRLCDLLAVEEGDSLGDLLDIGTGTARILEILAPFARRAEGIDLSREMLAVARANLARAGAAKCLVRQADMYDLPYPAASFDTVSVHQVLHFADEPERALGEAARVLRPGGRLVAVDFAPHDLEALRDEHAHRRLGLSEAEVTAWLRGAGLIPETVVHLPGTPLTVTLWLARKAAGVTGVERRDS